MPERIVSHRSQAEVNRMKIGRAKKGFGGKYVEGLKKVAHEVNG